MLAACLFAQAVKERSADIPVRSNVPKSVGLKKGMPFVGRTVLRTGMSALRFAKDSGLFARP